MGGGYADAVNSGTNACYVAIRALNLGKKSNIGVTLFTNPGVVNAITIAGFNPVILPIVSEFDHNIDIDIDKMERILIRNKLTALIINYAFGDIQNINKLIKICKKYRIHLIEDISQSVGGKYLGNHVGTFGSISFCSTMGRKNLTTGSSGGLVYTKDPVIYRRVLSLSDRGKKIYDNNVVSKDTSENSEISLNFSSDEFLCAIGLASLSRLPRIVEKRRRILNLFVKQISNPQINKCLKIVQYNKECAPFIGLIQILDNKLLNNKEKFCRELISKNFPINKKYGEIAATWDWLTPESKMHLEPQLAQKWQNRHIVLYLHEGYKAWYVKSLSIKLKKILNNIR